MLFTVGGPFFFPFLFVSYFYFPLLLSIFVFCFLSPFLFILPPSASFTIRFEPKCLANKIKQTNIWLDYDPHQKTLYISSSNSGWLHAVLSSAFLFLTLFLFSSQKSLSYPSLTWVPLIAYIHRESHLKGIRPQGSRLSVHAVNRRKFSVWSLKVWRIFQYS